MITAGLTAGDLDWADVITDAGVTTDSDDETNVDAETHGPVVMATVVTGNW